MARAIRMNARDNVAVVTAEVKAGVLLEVADGPELETTEVIPRGGKVALTPIAAREAVVRYGEEIGLATARIATGQHVHTHNLGAKE